MWGTAELCCAAKAKPSNSPWIIRLREKMKKRGTLTAVSRLRHRIAERVCFDHHVFVSEGYGRLEVVLRGTVWVSLTSMAGWP